MSGSDFGRLLQSVREVSAAEKAAKSKLLDICRILKTNIAHYDWVGFYLTDLEAERELVLGPYTGVPTEHTRIPYGKGICGQAADKKQTFIIQDVALEDNYLSCSPEVKAEIVLPIFKNGEIVGELDIDSHHIAPFTAEDQLFLAEVCSIVSTLF
jgi:L-methionine (R)-S-oxide reductase